ncbi:MAG: hypothetical protein LBB94_12400, partial [Clostridiales bacterium]|nr:hypothetical protein [Clostridiales bacterium]
MSRVKTGLILLLTGLAIYLTSQLWFANISSRNFFYSFFTRSEVRNSNDDKIFVWPYRIITNYGNNVFTIQYTGIKINRIRELCDDIIVSVLKEGEHLETREIKYAEILGAPGYIYEYAFHMPTSVFASAFGKSGFTDKLECITSIILLPPDAKRSVTIVWLLDEKNMLMSGYSTKSALSPVASLDEFYQDILYESSALSLYDDLSDKNTFIAKHMDSGYSYPAVAVINPYAEGELLKGAIEQHINIFFENPAAKLFFMGDNNVYTFVDANTVVKYFQNDVLDYSNYRAGSGEISVLNSFGAALNFIMSDFLIKNEYYLADFEQNE